MRPARTEIRSLTGLRGVAALSITIYHFGGDRALSPGFPKFDLNGAYLAVDAFFILSGFVLAYNYGDRFSIGFNKAAYSDFIIRRIAKIYPAYIGFLILYIVKMTVNISGDDPFRHFGLIDYVGNILMVNGWGIAMHPIIGPSWSVSAEMACYFLFPFMIYLICSPYWRTLYAIPIIAGLLLILRNANVGVTGTLDIVDGATLWPLTRAFCGFLTGIILFQIDRQHYTRLTPYLDVITLLALAACAILWFWGASDLLKFVGIAALILGLTQDTPFSRALFGNPVCHYLGKISYSLYLGHSLCIPIALRIGSSMAPMLGPGLTYAFTFILYLSMILGLATLAYPILEVGGKNAAMRFYHRGKSRSPLEV